MKTVREGINYDCGKCEYTCKTKPKVKFHVNSVCGTGKSNTCVKCDYNCDQCNCRSIRGYSFNAHATLEHERVNYKCVMNVNMQEQLSQH